jgi:hypothetical protein
MLTWEDFIRRTRKCMGFISKKQFNYVTITFIYGLHYLQKKEREKALGYPQSPSNR